MNANVSGIFTVCGGVGWVGGCGGVGWVGGCSGVGWVGGCGWVYVCLDSCKKEPEC